jgi:DNA polymerase
MSRPVTGLSSGGSLRALSQHFGLGEKGTEVYNTKGKHLKDFSAADLAAFGEYCKQDVNLTYQLYFKLLPRSPLKEMYLIDTLIRMFTEPVIELNTDLLTRHLEEVRSQKEAMLHSVGECREVFMSNDKFAEKLRELGVEPPTKVSPTTGKETYAFAKTDLGFQALLEHENPAVQALASARLGVKSTIEETRTQAFLDISKRGRMPILLNYYGAVNTGRMSGGDGTNPQNLPRGGVLRAAMMAPEGYKIVACDSSQIEARMTAWLAGQASLVEQFANGADVYSAFASIVYGKPINKHNNPTERHVGKTCLGADTEVLTNHGWKRIVDVTTDDLLWDGEEWVAHKGVIAKGMRSTKTMYGLSATPDHLCWDGTRFVPWETLSEHGEALKAAVSSVNLPSSAMPDMQRQTGEATAGNRTADAPADGKE